MAGIRKTEKKSYPDWEYALISVKIYLKWDIIKYYTHLLGSATHMNISRNNVPLMYSLNTYIT